MTLYLPRHLQTRRQRLYAPQPSNRWRQMRDGTRRSVRIIETGEVFGSVELCARYLEVSESTLRRALCGDGRIASKGVTVEYVMENL